MDEATENDLDPDWKPSLNDAHEDEIEFDEDEPPFCASIPRGSPSEEAESHSEEDYFPALDNEVDHSDLIHFKNVPIMTCHNELEVSVPIVEPSELSFI
jgi:hypothetical protein